MILRNNKKHRIYVTHSSKKAWNNFWHFSARSSLIIWPAFGFVPCSIRSIFSNKLLLQSYNDNVFSVPSKTQEAHELFQKFSREMLYHVIIFAPPGSNQILAFRCCHYNWTIVANHSRALCSGGGMASCWG